MRNILIILILLATVPLSSCGLLSPEQKMNAQAAIEQQVAAGHLTRAQGDAAIEALDQDFSSGIPGWIAALISIGSTILLGAPIAVGTVRLQRGPPTQKVGLPESKILKKE